MKSKSLSPLRFARPAAVTLLVVIGLLTILTVVSRAVEGVSSRPAIRPNLANPPAPPGEFVEGEILVSRLGRVWNHRRRDQRSALRGLLR